MFEAFWHELAISWPQVGSVIVSTSVLFWVFSALMMWFGQRLRLRVSITTLALMTVIGAVTARAMLGDAPKLAGGLIALVVLFAWEHAVRLVTRRASWRYPLTSARLVLIDGQVDNAALKAARIRPADLWIRLRRAGVTQLADVRYGIIEGDGSVTVIRAGQEVSPELLEGIVGLPASS